MFSTNTLLNITPDKIHENIHSKIYVNRTKKV